MNAFVGKQLPDWCLPHPGAAPICPGCMEHGRVVKKLAGKTAHGYVAMYECENCQETWYVAEER